MKSYNRVYAQINLDAIKENIANTKKILNNDTKIMAIIKADGYGHGSVQVAECLAKNGVDAFGVAIIEEGVVLRKRGITNPILILGYTSDYQYAELIQYELTQTVFKYSMAEAISEMAVALNKTAKIHIKIDTGMSRIGFPDNEESIETIKKIIKLPNLCVEGIFTHYARADERDKRYANKQFQRFDHFVNRLEKEGIHITVKHMANSAGIMDFDNNRYDMVRSGISTYGLYPSDEVNFANLKLTPALELKSNVIFVKTVAEGVGVSYNSTFVTTKRTKIATIPVGYADGYPRALSSKGRVLIRGQYAPIIGRICMDQFMVDVTDIEGIMEGDIVTLVGHDGEGFISAEEVADTAGSFNYEFVCGISRRVPRVYIENNEITKTVDYLFD